MTDKKPAPLQEWQRDAIAAEPRGFMQDIIQASRLRSQSASFIPDRQRSKETPRPPSGGSVPLKPVDGINAMDRIAEAFARRDRADAMRERIDTVRVETQWREFLMEQAKGPRVEHDYEPFDRENMEK
jgi:hypothetical protein